MAPNNALLTRPTAQLKTPKVTRDWIGQSVLLRDHILQGILDVWFRVASVIEEEIRLSSSTVDKLDVYIMVVGSKEYDGFLLERVAVAPDLWDARTKTEFPAKIKPKLFQQVNVSGGVLSRLYLVRTN